METSFKAFIDVKNVSTNQSKKRKIEQLYSEIDLAQKQGAKIAHLVMWVNEIYCLGVTEKYLNNILYRIRKERGETKTITTNTEKQNAQHTNINTAPLISNKRKEYDAICLKIAASEKGSHKEQYISYGGHFEDIQHQSDMATIHLLTRLKMAFHKKYDEFIE